MRQAILALGAVAQGVHQAAVKTAATQGVIAHQQGVIIRIVPGEYRQADGDEQDHEQHGERPAPRAENAARQHRPERLRGDRRR